MHNGHCRLRCGYCDADTGEQSSAEKAERIWNSFKKVERENAVEGVHVLTAEELLDSSRYSDDIRPVWFENRGIFCVPALLQCGIAEREHDTVRVEWHDSFGSSSYDMRNYGSWWRCWSDKPTAEQIESTAWA